MIICGSNAVHLKSVKPINGICPSCATQGSTVLSLFSIYAHIFWIPLFPIKKRGISECEYCSVFLEIKVLPKTLKREYKKLTLDINGPIWQFLGVLMIPLFIIWSIFYYC